MSYRVSGINVVKPESAKKALWRDQQGMALLVTIMTVSLLVAVTIQYHKTTWQQFLVSNNYKVETQLKVIADSGVNIALALLESDGAENQADSFLDSWATLDKENFAGLFPFGTLQLKVVDLSGRLQVNSLVEKAGENTETGGDANSGSVTREVFQNLLLSGLFSIEDETEARSIVDALTDWIDEDDQESDLGAESSFYQSLEEPYSCRNGPVRYIEELLLVKGVSPELLFGTGEQKGLADYLTVYGDDGKVNLSTAPLLVIQSFDALIGDDLLVRLDEYRRDLENKEEFVNLTWYKEIDGWPGDIVINENFLTIASSYFQIVAMGEFETLSRSVIAIAERSSEGEVKLLGKKTE
ncbi:MAG: type II secretion system minor pseudopilin GspK [Desulfobulbaceae bacterium]|nr:type II secretion system minor pseudopilin GspK [Desulfobulbaceae bacterium]